MNWAAGGGGTSSGTEWVEGAGDGNFPSPLWKTRADQSWIFQEKHYKVYQKTKNSLK